MEMRTNTAITMRRSKRKIGSKYGSSKGYAKPQSKWVVTDTVLNQTCRLTKNGSLTEIIFEVGLLRIIPHVWMKIVPTPSDDVENFAFSIGQEWKIIRPMLLRLGYLHKYGKSVRTDITRSQELEGITLNGILYQICTSQFKGSSKVVYICRKKTIFTYPCQQITSDYTYSSIIYFSRSDAKLIKVLNKN